MSALRTLLRQEHKRIGIFVWHKNQRVPAQSYLKAHAQDIKMHGAEVAIHVSRKSLRNGQRYRGKIILRYHFSSCSSGHGRG